jgi:hypothetical protein
MPDDVAQPAGSLKSAREAELDPLPGLLTQIGLIVTPASLIALFCGALDVSARSTAAISLLSVLLTANCLYRKRLNHFVPSSLLTALLIGCVAVFFFSYQNVLLKDTGLIKWYRHSNDYLAEIDHISAARSRRFGSLAQISISLQDNGVTTCFGGSRRA